jgi:hypothetical protein
MGAYHKSVLEYDDIIDALDFERRKSEKRGMERGRKEASANFVLNGVATGRLVEVIANLTKLTAKEVQTILA